jgi:hypothetical protein
MLSASRSFIYALAISEIVCPQKRHPEQQEEPEEERRGRRAAREVLRYAAAAYVEDVLELQHEEEEGDEFRADDPRADLAERKVGGEEEQAREDDDGVDGESESDRERSPVPAAPPPPPPTTPAGRLDAVVAALAALEAEAEPLTSRSARDRSPWPADAKKMATRVSEMATQALLKLDSIEPPDGDAAFRAARKAVIVRANALGDAMDALKSRLP